MGKITKCTLSIICLDVVLGLLDSAQTQNHLQFKRDSPGNHQKSTSQMTMITITIIIVIIIRVWRTPEEVIGQKDDQAKKIEGAGVCIAELDPRRMSNPQWISDIRFKKLCRIGVIHHGHLQRRLPEIFIGLAPHIEAEAP